MKMNVLTSIGTYSPSRMLKLAIIDPFLSSSSESSAPLERSGAVFGSERVVGVQNITIGIPAFYSRGVCKSRKRENSEECGLEMHR